MTDMLISVGRAVQNHKSLSGRLISEIVPMSLKSTGTAPVVPGGLAFFA